MLLFRSFFEQNHVICRFPADCWTIIKWIFSFHQVQLENTVCELCLKKCKSKSGLKRHITVKHKDTSNEGEQHRELGFVAYSRIVEKAKLKIVDNKIYPKEIRDQIESFTNLDDSSAEFSEIQSLHKRLKTSINSNNNLILWSLPGFLTIPLY